MPKVDIDYSNTIFYKIFCKDTTIKDLYVGLTTNFVQRKHAHKQSCINEKSPNYKCKLYEVIRNNGGWENWKMEIINFFNCKNHYEARKKEQEYFLSLNATLNSIEPYAIPKPKVIVIKNKVIKQVFPCKECNKYFNNKDLLEIHNKTNKHKKKMVTENFTDFTKKFSCNYCNITCNRKSEWERHLLTNKHIGNITGNKETIKTDFQCETCNKIYKSRKGLWGHNKICKDTILIEQNTIIDSSLNEIKLLTNLVIELVKNNTELQKQTCELQKQNQDVQKQNQDFQKQTTELQKQMIEVCQKIQPTIINNNNTNTNSHNKTFNLQLFLNEECKDAMNMSDFINSIELKISDLENIGKLGYVEGMSSIIIKQLNDTDMYKRPVHCSDAKRETMYVKEENKWEKDNNETKQMIKAVRGVDKKNYQMLTSWKNTQPKCVDSKSHECDKYMKVMSKVMDGDIENVNKVIKKVAKEVLIDKS